MNEPVWVLDAAVLIAHEISLANFGGADGIRDAGLLESALAKPRNLFAYGKPSLFEMAASYSYGIIKNHPFVDGNKRTGFLVGATFLELNGWQLTATETQATEAILSVAAGALGEKELAKWYERNCDRIDVN